MFIISDLVLRHIYANVLIIEINILFQPPSIVSDVVCTACDFNRPGKNCLRKLEWVWRGETFMAKKRFSLFILIHMLLN